MNITLNTIDPVNALLKMDVVKADYESEVEKSLKDLRQKAAIPGFRKGMVPMSVVKKMYGKSVLIEQVNKVVSHNLYNYIRENQLNILGEPLPNETEQKEIDFDHQENFEFCFDLGLAPEIQVKLTKKDKLPYYNILVEDSMVENQLNSFCANQGSYSQVETIEGKDMVKGYLVELDENGEPKKDGIQNESAVLMPSYIKDEEEKAKFMGTSNNTVVTFNPYKAYEGSEVELSSFLKIKKEEVKDHTGNFSLEIHEITRYTEAELNQELFDKVFGEGVVQSEEEFRAKVKEMIATQTIPDSDYRLLIDFRQLVEKKAGKVEFPDAFLKRWMLVSDSNRTAESIETDYPKIIEDLEFHLIKEELVKENGIKVEEGDLMEYARRTVKAQFAQYGFTNFPEDAVEGYAKDMLKKEETVRNLIDKIIEDKLIDWIKEHITLENKEVNVDEFKKLFE